MIDWAQLTLFLYILARMSGFVLFSPLLGRTGLPGIFRSGFILVLSVAVAAATTQTVTVPSSVLVLILHLSLELALGYLLGLVMHFFFSIPALAGEVIDTQMGMTMAKTYDAGAQTSLSVTATFLNILLFLLFFAANGHHTLLQILLSSGAVVPFGAVTFGNDVVEAVAVLFVDAVLLSVKLSLPILAAELMGQAGMGILMKAIPQINVFAINIELKVIVGLLLLYLMITPFSDFLLGAETTMLSALRQVLALAH